MTWQLLFKVGFEVLMKVLNYYFANFHCQNEVFYHIIKVETDAMPVDWVSCFQIQSVLISQGSLEIPKNSQKL